MTFSLGRSGTQHPLIGEAATKTLSASRASQIKRLQPEVDTSIEAYHFGQFLAFPTISKIPV